MNRYMVKEESKALAGVVVKTLVVNLAVRFLGNAVIYSIEKAEDRLRKKRHPVGFITTTKVKR